MPKQRHGVAFKKKNAKKEKVIPGEKLDENLRCVNTDVLEHK